MYKGLVTALRKRAHDLPEKFSKNAENIDLFLKAADAIKELSKPQWIPVTERLPERGYYVLVYEDGDILMASYADGNWVLRDMYEVIDDLKPTHWMPLPEPPKEGE